MGYEAPIRYSRRLTSKGQVTVPKAIRDALGLQAGSAVRFKVDDDGSVTIAKVDREKEKEAYLGRVREAQQEFGGKERFGGLDGVAYQRWIRGDGPEV